MTTRLRKYKQSTWGNGATMSRLSIKRHLLIVERVLQGRRYKAAGQAALVSNADAVNKMLKSGLMLVRRVVNEPWLPVSGRVDLVRRDKEAWLERELNDLRKTEEAMKRQEALDNLGELMHTGWRKAHDSRWSSLVWNLVHILPTAGWTDLTTFAKERLSKAQPVTAEVFAQIHHGYLHHLQARLMSDQFKKELEADYDCAGELGDRRGYRTMLVFALVLDTSTGEDVDCDLSWWENCLRGD